jgi:tetratricopeptide (TPR) repeat protein
MASFTALNVEPDDAFDENVDNAREIQIEEALKLYQTALKLHAQGPQYYEPAATSYDALFKSEIFRYPESITDFERLEENPQANVEHDPAFPAGDVLDAVPGEAASSLPQILFLAYKNHGQFILDCLRHKIKQGQDLSQTVLLSKVETALRHFCQALARDESDTELWRKASRMGSLLGSRAIARYCLEAAVEVDDDPAQGEVEPAILEEGFAGMRLKDHLEVLSDEVALSHPIMAPYIRKTMSLSLRKYLDPYPFLPQPSSISRSSPAELQDQIITLTLSERSWFGLGDALWRACLEYDESGATVILVLPEEDKHMIDSPVERSDQPVQANPSISIPKSKAEEINASSLQANSQIPPIGESGAIEAPDVSANGKDGEYDTSSVGARKRSQSVAGIQETPDEDAATQKRSKRIRNRDSTVGGSPPDPVTQFQEQLAEVKDADAHVFSYTNSLLKKFGVQDMGSVAELQDALTRDVPGDREEMMRNTAARDLRDAMKSWTDTKAAILMAIGGLEIITASHGSANSGILAFLEHSKPGPKKTSAISYFPVDAGLASMVEFVNAGHLPLHDVVFQFLVVLWPSYTRNLWSDPLKHTIVRLINRADAEIFARLQEEVEHLQSIDDEGELAKLREIALMLYEIHLDIYASISDQNSTVDLPTRIKEKDSVERWRTFATALVENSIGSATDDEMDDLTMRYLWSSVFFASLADNASREHIIACWTDLQKLLEDADNRVIDLPNNAVMPEISAAAADREISRLTSMDFIISIFQADKSNPSAVIESLEPVLDPISAGLSSATEHTDDGRTSDDGHERVTDTAITASAELRDMWKFLQSGSTKLRLFLWQRLREAYEAIKYPTKVFSCHLKCIGLIATDIATPSYVDSSPEVRQQTLLGWFKTLDDLLVKALTIALNESTAFEIIDDAHLKQSVVEVAQLCRTLHSAALFDDSVRVGMVQLPSRGAYSTQGTYNAALMKLREMQVRSWALLYTLIKEGMTQNPELFPTMENDLADYLAGVHYSLGLRKCCKVSNKIFLKMMRVEVVRMKNLEKWEDYTGQVLYDLYGISLGTGTYELMDHGCPTENLDKRATLGIADHVISLAKNMSMKDLLKSDLRTTIEKMQQAIGVAKTTPQVQHNMRIYKEYLKSSIHPLHMIQALKGTYSIDTAPVSTAESHIASKGWYFLLGMISFTKFRSQKRLSPGATDDLKVAETFFHLQLQYASDLWETWYRWAQCYDAELEEEILWSAEKVNSNRSSIVQLQRSSLHCYIMALSTAMRTADASLDTASKMSEMCHDFGLRIYSSSRAPFNMEAFKVEDFERHFSDFSGVRGIYKRPAHPEVTPFKAWRYAAGLFKRAIREAPNNWLSHYYLGKCLWKLYSQVPPEGTEQPMPSRPEMREVIHAFERAIETVPKPSRAEPILEPHYKLMSIAHKLVCRGDLSYQDAAALLQRQPFAIRKGQSVELSTPGEWGALILESLRHLRNADKSNWHHRMINRVARILCPHPNPSHQEAFNASAELRTSMFTKTMVVQVWKPEFERPGRHCVYTNRYVSFMVKLLVVLDDKASMEALVKRVRKKQADYYKFQDVWSECCLAYARLMRRAFSVPIGEEENLKTMFMDDFTPISDALDNWVADTTNQHPALDCLREAIELKKLNQNCIKPALFEDLIADAWATLVLKVGMTLPRAAPVRPPSPIPEVRSSQGPMSLNNLVSNMEGVSTTPQPQAAEPLVRRLKGVSRRETVRRGEAAIARVAEGPRSSVSGGRGRATEAANGGSGKRVTVDIEPIIIPQEEELSEGEDGDSANGSVHDSADDESDLSDVPDDGDTERQEESEIQKHIEKEDGTGGTEAALKLSSDPNNGPAFDGVVDSTSRANNLFTHS